MRYCVLVIKVIRTHFIVEITSTVVLLDQELVESGGGCIIYSYACAAITQLINWIVLSLKERSSHQIMTTRLLCN
jgi:hypothetical protein